MGKVDIVNRAITELTADIIDHASSIAGDYGCCLDYALAANDLYEEAIGGIPELQDEELRFGYVLAIEGGNEGPNRLLHASNYLAWATRKTVHLRKVDTHSASSALVTAENPVVRAVNALDDRQSTAYAQKSPKGIWRVEAAEELRQPPFRLNPDSPRLVIMDESVGKVAVQELLSSMIEINPPDRSKIPVLLLDKK